MEPSPSGDMLKEAVHELKSKFQLSGGRLFLFRGSLAPILAGTQVKVLPHGNAANHTRFS